MSAEKIHTGPCREDGCDKTDVHAKGLCLKHYHDARRHGRDPLVPRRKDYAAGPCKEEGCTKRSERHGLCYEHDKDAPECIIDGCTNRARCRQRCRRHYDEYRGFIKRSGPQDFGVWDLEPLVELVEAGGGVSNVGINRGVPPKERERLRDLLVKGIEEGYFSTYQADELAVCLFDVHPCMIWHDWFTQGFEDEVAA